MVTTWAVIAEPSLDGATQVSLTVVDGATKRLSLTVALKLNSDQSGRLCKSAIRRSILF